MLWHCSSSPNVFNTHLCTSRCGECVSCCTYSSRSPTCCDTALVHNTCSTLTSTLSVMTLLYFTTRVQHSPLHCPLRHCSISPHVFNTHLFFVRYDTALVHLLCSALTCALSIAACVSLVARAVVGARHVVTPL